MTIEINKKLAEHLREIAQMKAMLASGSQDKYGSLAYERVAKFAEFYNGDIKNLLISSSIPGAGKSISLTIFEFLTRGTSSRYEELVQQCPKEALELTIIRGVGPKRALHLYQQGYKSFDDLHKAALNGAIEAKLTGAIIEAAKKLQNKKEEKRIVFVSKIPLAEAQEIANEFRDKLISIDGVLDVVACGSIRRKKDEVKDIDLVVCLKDDRHRQLVSLEFEKMGKFFVGGEYRNSISHEMKSSDNTAPTIQIDMWMCTRENFGAMKNYATGSKEHNIRLRALANEKGWRVNEYGIFDTNNKKLGGENEEDLYALLDIPYVEPEDRVS